MVAIQQELDAVQSEFSTTLQEDVDALKRGGLSAWKQVALEYRVERKRIAAAVSTVLKIYARVSKL